MTDIDSIIPSPELIEQWLREPRYVTAEQAGRYLQMISMAHDRFVELMERSANYGADQELEALLTLLRIHNLNNLASDLLAARRTKPEPKVLPVDDPLLENCSKAVLNRARQIDEMITVNVYGPHEPDTCASSWFTSKLIASLEERISTLESLSD